MRQSSLLAMAALVWLSGAAAAAQPAVTAKSRPQPAAIARPAAAVRPQVYRVPRELSGGDTHPFATEFYGAAPKAKKPAAVPAARKSPVRAAQR